MAARERQGSAAIAVKKISKSGTVAADDFVAMEEPLAIQLAWPVAGEQVTHNIAVTMRTPVNDFDLALGFLFTEGFITSADQVANVSWVDADAEPAAQGNRLVVNLHAPSAIDPRQLQRNFFVSSSCGVCGKASIDAITAQAAYPVCGDELSVDVAMLNRLSEQLAAGQSIFAGTGSIHAAALFDAGGMRGLVYEDVGRHNAVDKLLGANLRAGMLPLWNKGIIVSGRASFELVQKARMAGCPMLVAVGAPSSLAVELAWESGMSLIGFLRDARFNVYAGPTRISPSA